MFYDLNIPYVVAPNPAKQQSSYDNLRQCQDMLVNCKRRSVFVCVAIHAHMGLAS
jgi:hypothetical protein